MQGAARSLRRRRQTSVGLSQDRIALGESRAGNRGLLQSGIRLFPQLRCAIQPRTGLHSNVNRNSLSRQRRFLKGLAKGGMGVDQRFELIGANARPCRHDHLGQQLCHLGPDGVSAQ